MGGEKAEAAFNAACDLINVSMVFVMLGQSIVLDGPRWMGWIDGTLGAACLSAVAFRRVIRRLANGRA